MKILEVNNIDLLGSRFNGYDLMEYINKNSSNSCNMAVIHKLSDNDNVFPIAFSREINMIERLYNLEQSILSVHSILSISSSLLMKSEVYKEADIVHFHMFHNSHFSLFDLKKIAQEKKVIISLHDPWFVTGHCVHPFECEKWKFGCKNCPHLDYMFPMKRGQAGALWNLKKSVFNSIDCDLIVSSPYMKYLVKNSPILKRKRLHYLPLGIDTNKFVSVDSSELRKKYGIKSNDLVFFLRSQKEFKGTEYVLEALKSMDVNSSWTFITCGEIGLLNDVKDKFNIVEFGVVKDENKLIELYNLCDAFLMPSVGESFGFMAVEAMSCGKPVIVFDNSSLPGVTFAPECGVLVKNKDSVDLKEKIMFLANNEEERIRRGNLGRQLVLENYDIDNYNNKMLDIYEKVMKHSIKKQEKSNTKNDAHNLEILKSRLKVINKGLNIKDQKFSFLNTKYRYCAYKNDIIDYNLDDVQILIDKYNKLLLEFSYVEEKKHPFKTAIHLLRYDKRKFVDTLKEKMRCSKNEKKS